MKRLGVSAAILIFMFLMSLYSCVSEPGTVSHEAGQPGTAGQPDNAEQQSTPLPDSVAEPVPLAVPSDLSSKKNKKSGLYRDILTLLEKGTAQSLNAAADLAVQARRSAELAPDVQDLLVVADRIMSLVYPLDTWTAVDFAGIPSNYLAAVESAKSGVYDYNTGNSDLLEQILPSLVLLVSPRSAYFADAAAALDSGIKSNSESVLALYLRGVLYALQGDTVHACELQLRAAALEPDCYPVIVELVKLGIAGAAAAGDYVARAERLAARYPSSLQMLELQARAAFSAENWQKADTYVTRVLQRTPGNSDFLLMRAHILIEKKDYLKANALLDAYEKVDSHNRSYLLLRARLQREWNRNFKAAAATLSEAYERSPQDVTVLLAAADMCLSGTVTVAGKNSDDFIAAVRAIDSTNERARVLSVLNAHNKERWQDVVQFGRTLLDSKHRDVVLLPVCDAYNMIQQPDQALAVLRPLFDASQNDSAFMDVYLDALIRSGNGNQADTIITQRLNTAPPLLRSVFFYYKSILFRESADSSDEGVLSDLRSSLLANPRNGKSLMAMYRFYYDKQDYRKSMYYLKQAIALDVGNTALIEKQRELERLIK